VQPAFHKERLAAFAGVMAHHTGGMLHRWAVLAARGEAVDVAAEMMRLTLTVVCHALFGLDVLGDTRDAGRAITTAIRLTNERFSALVDLPTALPTRRNLRFVLARRVLVRLVDDIIATRRRAAPREDLLGLLMDARDAEGGDGLGDRELRDEVMTMLLAGHETTANALSWALFLLARAPAADRKLHEESAAVLGRGAPTLEDLPRLRYATLVHQEAMRLYPPAWIMGRQAIAADSFGPFEVPPGATVSLCPWLLHRDVRYWADPERFDPERFAPEVSSGRPRFSYFPFAAGPRMCIGNGFAMMEMQIVLAMVAARHRLELVAGRPVEAEPSVTLRPRRGIWMTIHPR
jgi:cytochrome P450